MEYKDNKSFISWSRLKKSFHYASQGVRFTWKNEQNFRIHTLVAFIVFIAAQVFNIPLLEQAVLFIAVGAVLCLELLNTSIEHITDLIIQTYDERAKIIKDTAAGAVLVFSLTAAIVGGMIFIPRIIHIIF
ncbi:diacylglycerol kinase family protein [Alkalicoccus daliensis]|uniref:Undecaprenol kinase n=1 Tax=Alkalicoccus daliensis TaxID=745820 RepID=A0A1H0BCK1_9BACI|nr:diacylglycerol kinase family protein [Alkalicoccus daliensis]SDN43402.1 undecaprenol kinase [Alkalicoccus daliensis]